MNGLLMTSLFLFGVLLWTTTTFTTALSCDSCGQECAAACGSRHFRACCFNYLRKRNTGGVGESLHQIQGGEQFMDSSQYLIPGLRLDLWLATKPQHKNGESILPAAAAASSYYAELSRTSRDIQQFMNPNNISTKKRNQINRMILDSNNVDENVLQNGGGNLNNSNSNNDKSLYYDEP